MDDSTRSTTDSRPATKAVLVAEDNEMIMSVISTALNMHGYEVMGSSDGRNVLEIFRENQNCIGLALIDRNIPSLSGCDLIRELRDHNPNLPVIMTSGYYEDCSQPLENVTFLQKPFQIPELISLVRDLSTK